MKLPSLRAKASTVNPNVLSPGTVYAASAGAGGNPRSAGGGYWWGSGPRTFVGSRPSTTVVEVGREGDFPEGAHVFGPTGNDQGFPYSSRWPGWVGDWTPPFFTGSGGGPDWRGRFNGGALLEGRVSTVFTCVDLISRTLATLPIVGSKDSASFLLPPWHDNPEPEVYTSIVDAMKAIVNSMLMRGQAFIAPTARYADGQVARWVVLNPDVVIVEAGKDGLPVYNVSGVDIPRTEILHLRYQVWPGLVSGVGPLEAAWRNLVSADALEQWGTSLALGNGLPIAVLQASTKLSGPQAQALQASWAASAATRGTLPIVLSGGLTYTPLNLKPSDVGLLDLRTFDEQRIASCFGVPLWLVGLPMKDGLTYSTVSGTFDYFWRATLRPFSYNIMQGLSNFCLPRGIWARHDADAFTQPDFFQRAEAYNLLVQAGAVTPAEVRVRENLEPMPTDEGTAILAANLEGGL